MTQEQNRLVYEALTYMDGLQNLLREAEDEPLQFLKPFELLLILQPVTDRLTQALDDTYDAAA